MEGFGERLAKARKAAGWTQEALADAIRVHKFTISKWERGDTRPGKPSDFDALGQALNVSAAWLRAGEGDPGAPYEPEEAAHDARRRRARAIPALAAKQRPGTDWQVVGRLARQLVDLDPTVGPEHLGRALTIAYALHQRGAWDEDLARQILAGVSLP